MIIYENENTRLLIEEGGINLVDKFLSKYSVLNSPLYITEKTALSLYNMYYKKEIEENPSIILNKKRCKLIPVLKMKWCNNLSSENSCHKT